MAVKREGRIQRGAVAKNAAQLLAAQLLYGRRTGLVISRRASDESAWGRQTPVTVKSDVTASSRGLQGITDHDLQIDLHAPEPFGNPTPAPAPDLCSGGRSSPGGTPQGTISGVRDLLA